MLLEKLGFSGTVMVLGLLVVFIALILLIAIIPLMSKVIKAISKEGKSKKSLQEVAKKKEEKAPAAPAPVAVQVADNGEIVAAIAAAIAMMEAESGTDGRLVVRSIRRVSRNIPAWGQAGKNEQVYSRY